MQAQKFRNLSFSERFLELTEQSGRTQKEHAAIFGVAEGTVINWKRGQLPKSEELYSIAQNFGVTMEWLLTGEKDAREEWAESLRGWMEGRKWSAPKLASEVGVKEAEVDRWLEGEIPSDEKVRFRLEKLEVKVMKYAAQAGPSLGEMQKLNHELSRAKAALAQIRQVATDATDPPQSQSQSQG